MRPSESTTNGTRQDLERDCLVRDGSAGPWRGFDGGSPTFIDHYDVLLRGVYVVCCEGPTGATLNPLLFVVSCNLGYTLR